MTSDRRNAAAPDPDLLSRRRAHWPHAAARCRAHLDLEAIEGMAVRILARGIHTQRLIAFVGAGASMAYGRLTWRGLMSTLYEQMASHSDNSEWLHTQKQLWPEGLVDFLKDTDHPLKSQELSDAWDRRRPGAEGEGDGASNLQRATQSWLKDFHGFVDSLVARLSEGGGTVAPSPQGMQERRTWLQGNQSSSCDVELGLKGVLASLHALDDWIDTGDDAGQGLPGQAVRKALLALERQSKDVDSPVRQMVLDWGIRRFITTNYDSEIERGLEALSFTRAKAGHQEVQRNQYEVLSFGKRATGNALRFALEGPRRHASVLHIHGDVANAESLIITESHYQQLYLDDHPQRDLVTNATLANFAANPMLFVGSDVNEDDVLRPMRQFMSGPGHRKDRMAVALFMAIQAPAKRAQQKAKLLLKYGVCAIHIGRVDQFKETPPHRAGYEKFGPDDWLHRLHRAAIAVLESAANASAGEASKRSEPPSVLATALLELAAELRALGEPTKVEGVELAHHPSLAFASDLTLLLAHLEQLGDAANLPLQGFAMCKTLVLIETTVNRVMSCFLCLKLIELRRRANETISQDMRLALTYGPHDRQREPKGEWSRESNKGKATKDAVVVLQRHGVSLARRGMAGRFAEIDKRATEAGFDEGLAELLRSVVKDSDLSTPPGRRVLVACATRGCGKGAQSDRLTAVDASGRRPHLELFLRGLGGYFNADGAFRSVVIHINLSFSNELGRIVSQVTDLLHDICDEESAAQPRLAPCKDQLEMLERGMRRFSKSVVKHRLLIVLGNAGVLFDQDGLPKNGLVRRVLRLLLSPRFKQAPIDLLMYVGESQVPEALRSPMPATPTVQQAPAPAPAETPPEPGPDVDGRSRRRLSRLNIGPGRKPGVLIRVHALRPTRVSDLAAAYFPGLAKRLGWNTVTRGSAEDDLARDLYFATGSSRFAQTLILALLDSCDQSRELQTFARDLVVDLNGPPSGSAVETAIEVVLDRWAEWHLLEKTHLDDSALFAFGAPSGPLADAMRWLTRPLRAAGWRLASELLWHLSAFSHPVEREVLLSCPRVRQAANALASDGLHGAHTVATLVDATLELLVHWCLLFRVKPRSLPNTVERNGIDDDAYKAAHQWRNDRFRYATHRHMQRHFLRLMGGRNVESTQWDQFTTTLYASLPDEAPSLRPHAHRALTEVVETLTRYPVTEGELPVPPWSNHRDARAMVEDADRIRAAYYLVRSTYSLGVISHLVPQESEQSTECGHMEHYRRLVRWITHAAQYWEQAYRVRDHTEPKFDKKHFSFRWARGDADLKAQEHALPMGLFYPGELIWLYNECGVISLAQGKLHDAEQLLTMAEQAARKVEADDSGSLHTRIRIHTALVQIERGRPHRARQILQPIADRRDGHPVPPLLAQAYLGMIEHIGGNYRRARDLFDSALDGLRSQRRSRAVAFVLMWRADVELGLRRDHFESSLGMADEAISLAQQGGHEDLRVMATLARVRIRIDGHSTAGQHLFEQISFAQRYSARMDIPRLACEAHELRARLLLLQGEYHLSAADATASLEIAAMYDLKLLKARGLLTLAQIYQRRGDVDGARSLATMGAEIATSCDYYACVKGFKALEMSFEPAQHRA